MPKRTDIHTVLVIGSGPIVIGQACEFDYSGTQACKALREEGYRVVLVNSNPATIMTDPETADRTYVEPMTVEGLEKIIERDKPDALLPTLGGQTALNLALELHAAGVLERVRRRADRRQRRGDQQGRGPSAVQRGDGEDRPVDAALGLRRTRWRKRARLLSHVGLPAIIRARRSRWAAPAPASRTTTKSSTASSTGACSNRRATRSCSSRASWAGRNTSSR